MIKSNSVVVVGDLNPSIFSPAWVRSHVDIVVDDGGDAQVQIIHPDIADFMLSDIRFTVERNRIVIASLAHDMELLVPLTIQLFGEVLSHTPIWAYGVNFERHVDFQSFEKRNALGRTLCPLDPWGPWAQNLQNRDPLLNGGMASVSMKKILSSKPEKYEMLTVAPSNKKEMINSGVFFQLNNHYAIPSGQSKQNEENRAAMLVSMRENVTEYVSNFDEIVSHFQRIGDVDE